MMTNYINVSTGNTVGMNNS